MQKKIYVQYGLLLFYYYYPATENLTKFKSCDILACIFENIMWSIGRANVSQYKPYNKLAICAKHLYDKVLLLVLYVIIQLFL